MNVYTLDWLGAERVRTWPSLSSWLVAMAAMADRFLAWAFDSETAHSHARAIPARDGHHVDKHAFLVIDASHSMSEPDWPPCRLGAAKEAAQAYVDRLASEQPQTLVAIVAYGTDARVCCSLTPAAKAAALRKAIRNISYLGATNMRAGLKAAANLLENRQGEAQVVLLTDGHNTAACPLSVAECLKTKKALIECVGIGGRPEDVDESLLKDIASAYPDGTKRYRWIGEKQRLVKHFHELAGRISRT